MPPGPVVVPDGPGCGPGGFGDLLIPAKMDARSTLVATGVGAVSGGLSRQASALHCSHEEFM